MNIVVLSSLAFLAVLPTAVGKATAANGETASSPARGKRILVYEARSDFSGSQERATYQTPSGRYRVEIEDGTVVSAGGLLDGNLTVVVADKRARELGFFDFLGPKPEKEWRFKYWSLAKRWFYGTSKVIGGGETVKVAAGTFVTDKIERVIDSGWDNRTTYWYSHELGVVVKLHHRLVKPDGTLVREIYYELAEYGPLGRR